MSTVYRRTHTTSTDVYRHYDISSDNQEQQSTPSEPKQARTVLQPRRVNLSDIVRGVDKMLRRLMAKTSKS